jgi:hypothetical protein
MTDRKVVEEALFRFSEVVRLQSALSEASRQWTEWVAGLNEAELRVYVENLPAHLEKETQDE